jgi:hypothetical protein
MATVQEYIKREEQDQIFYLLTGLSSEFEEVRRDILIRPELSSINTICSIIQSGETRKRVMGNGLKVNHLSPKSENYAHFTSFKSEDHNKWKGKEKKGSKYYCDHCNRSGHTRDRCFILHPHLKSTRNRSNEINLAVQPQNSEVGNVQEKLEQLSKQMEFLMKRCTAAPDSLPTCLKGETINLVQHNGNQLALFVFRAKIIVDSGVTDNMFSCGELLTETHIENANPHITVANGSSVTANGSGKTRIFSKDLDAIIVPNLKANLLSVGKCTNR